jgi:hypothetical protein
MEYFKFNNFLTNRTVMIEITNKIDEIFHSLTIGRKLNEFD